MKRKFLNKRERKERKEWKGLSGDGLDKKKLIKLMSEFMTIMNLIGYSLNLSKSIFLKVGIGHYLQKLTAEP